MTPAAAQPAWARACNAVAESARFQRFILGVIVAAGLLTGVETYAAVRSQFGRELSLLDGLVIAIFVVEILVRIGAHGRRPWRFFLDGWNVFDFLIVAACLAPIGAQHAAVARLVRLLRVFRLFSGVGRLRLIVAAMLHALPSIAYVALLLFLLFYVYAVLGTTLFRYNDPIHFGNLHTSMLSLLRTVTLEDWTDLMYIQIYGSDVYGYEAAAAKLSEQQRMIWSPDAMPITATVYFASFVLIGTMIVLNLFVGVVISSLSDAQNAQARDALLRAGSAPGLDSELQLFEQRVDELQRQARRLRASFAELDGSRRLDERDS